MLKYKENVLELLKNAGYSTYLLTKNKVFGPQTIQDMRNGKIIGIKSLDTVCTLLQCQPGDLLEWIPDIPENHDLERQTAQREAIGAALDDCAEKLKLPWEE